MGEDARSGFPRIVVPTARLVRVAVHCEATIKRKRKSERHKRDTWTTPQSVFALWNRHFDFTLDAAASYDNTKCKFYFAAESEGIVVVRASDGWCAGVDAPHTEMVWQGVAQSSLQPTEPDEVHEESLCGGAAGPLRTGVLFAPSASKVIIATMRRSIAIKLNSQRW